ncbi:MAG TPA: hypothetical protein VMX55_07575 [candidate division Zixibacteria bacterium]|nr:hypothetical protein [candidate division Zixibacteria bacterium]
MSTTDNEKESKTLFETRFMSIVLMVILLIMCILFVVVVWQFFGKEPAIDVIIYTSIGIGGGGVITIILLLIFRNSKIKNQRNIFFGTVFMILLVSLIVSVILKFTISDPLLSSWYFIYASSIGLGITTGIALSYLILATFGSKLVELKTEQRKSTKINSEEVEGEVN